MKLFFTILTFASGLFARAQFINTMAGTGAIGPANGSYGGDGGLAIAANLKAPYKLCVDATGAVYFADVGNHRVRKIHMNGIITTIAGNGFQGFGGDGGPAVNAELEFPASVCIDGSGNLYISDLGNNRIRKVDQNGIITTVAGSGATGFGNGSYSGDGGPAVSATLNGPISMYVDATGTLFIADSYNHRVRKVDTNGIITTLAGTGLFGYVGDGGPAFAARLNHPSDVTADVYGNLFIADANNNCIRKINTSGIITTVAGNGNTGYSGDGGPAIYAEFSQTIDVDIDSSGNMYIVDMYNNCIRKVDTNGIVATVAGMGAFGFEGDGGLATAAHFSLPSGLACKNDKLYIGDQFNHRIRMVCNSAVSFSMSVSDTIVCPWNPVVLNANSTNTYTYAWSNGQTGINTITASPSVSTTYYVLGTDSNGCVGSGSKTVLVDVCLGAGEAAKGGQLKIYPNPVRSELNLRNIPFPGKTSHITLINSLGQVVRSASVSKNPTGVYTLDVADLKNGLYFVLVENNSTITTKLFTKTE